MHNGPSSRRCCDDGCGGRTNKSTLRVESNALPPECLLTGVFKPSSRTTTATHQERQTGRKDATGAHKARRRNRPGTRRPSTQAEDAPSTPSTLTQNSTYSTVYSTLCHPSVEEPP
ncbi:hypothetical protein E2C01_012392 [Portunus trituberculatus]|uniref:Uncharacterized protein n=1 Tax=Portunus trituberculatus TaxID=210409 RepID=A0A5B7DE32_PORTR|nr:hypothetical protein [Portunus trituberculatus]